MTNLRGFDTHQKFEPVYGCHLSAYVEADEWLRSYAEERDDRRTPREILGGMIGKRLAVSWN
jgi:hypothetical protein